MNKDAMRPGKAAKSEKTTKSRPQPRKTYFKNHVGNPLEKYNSVGAGVQLSSANPLHSILIQKDNHIKFSPCITFQQHITI